MNRRACSRLALFSTVTEDVMGSFLRITLLSLFAASGVGAAICVALFALPAKHKPDATAAQRSRTETANDTSASSPKFAIPVRCRAGLAAEFVRAACAGR